MQGERMQILKMLESGKITADEAMKLLDTIESGDEREPARRKTICVRISDGERDKVKVNLPVHLAKVALRVAGKFDERLREVDVDSLMHEIEAGAEGPLVEVTEGSQRVEITIA